MTETSERPLSKVERAIATLKFLKKGRQRKIDDLLKRHDLTENQKVFIGEETNWMKCTDVLIQTCELKINELLGKLPPAAVDIEEAILGAVMLEKGSFEKVSIMLKPKHFYKEIHAIIFQACLTLFVYNKPIDMRTVVAELRKTGQLELIGGAFYIAELTSKVSSAANIQFHAAVIVEQAILRELIMLGSFIHTEVFGNNVDCFRIIDEVEQQLAAMKPKVQ